MEPSTNHSEAFAGLDTATATTPATSVLAGCSMEELQRVVRFIQARGDGAGT